LRERCKGAEHQGRPVTRGKQISSGPIMKNVSTWPADRRQFHVPVPVKTEERAIIARTLEFLSGTAILPVWVSIAAGKWKQLMSPTSSWRLHQSDGYWSITDRAGELRR
jgi:hypothetical protein